MSGRTSTQPLDPVEESAPVTPTTTPSAPSKIGTVSKMRSHRGNIPTLPQTKFCPLCSAKFTRTTHLTRHLKTHSNERLHECDRCHAQFTRSDLLTRHKRTCCDSAANRSRRKSCQSCADSKIKCDLQRPCSKCKARGRKCVYLNAPAVIAEASNGSTFQNDSASPEITVDPSSSTSSQQLESPPGAGPSPLTSSETVAMSSTLTSPVTLFDDPTSSFISTPASSANDDTPASLSAYTADTDIALPAQNVDYSAENAYFAELFSSEMYDNLFADLFMSSFQKNPVVPGQHFQQDPTTILIDRLELTSIDQALMDAFETPAQLAIYSMPSPSSPSSHKAANSIPEAEIMLPGSNSGTIIRRPMPSISEFYEYMTLFFNTFLYHMPVVHVPTFLAEPRHYILVEATKAAGAMYAHTTIGLSFIDYALATLRDQIIVELSHTTDYDTLIHLTLASGILQTIGLFHKDPDQRAKSNVYHGMIVTIIRMSGFVEKTRDWKLPEINFSDPVSVQQGWREWTRHESAKRAIWLCYLHDCCHLIYYNISPTFHTEQFTLGMPAEDGLWTATNATEWAILLQKPSPYGSIEVRLRGHYLKALYYYFSSDNPDNGPRPFCITPFGHFIMIHAMIRKLFEMYLRDRLPHQDGVGMGVRRKLLPHFVDRDRVFHVQILLHYWLQSWLESPETPRDVPETQQRFCFNALPLYWLVQVGLVAYQEGLPPFDPDGVCITSQEAKFKLLKKWEKHIRKFLESGEQESTKFWDEVMKIRIESWQAESGFEFAHLLGFFHPPAPRPQVPV